MAGATSVAPLNPTRRFITYCERKMVLTTEATFNILLQTVAARGGQVTATNGTAVTLRGETINIRLREASERRPKQDGSATFRDNEYVPTEMLSFSVDHQQGSDLKTLVRDATDVERFLDKLSRFV